jgi:signal transduction histidine kinase
MTMFALAWALVGWLCAALLVRQAAARAELVARASHELRGPLTAAMLALHDAPGVRAAAVEAQLHRARLALDDLLAAPRGDRAPDRLEPVALSTLTSQVERAWRPAAAAQGRDLRVAPAPAGVVVLADGTRLAQAVGNLIANALEHGAGPVEVRARVVAGRARLEVRDAGPGLTAPVAQIAARPRRGRHRRGRGIAIAAEIAARHGGRLTAAPATAGAALVLDLPVAGETVAVLEATT